MLRLVLAVYFLVLARAGASDRGLSHAGSFSIVQSYEEDGDSYLWASRLVFTHPKKTVILKPDLFSWSSLYYISPDNKWILRLQRTGSGDNNAILYGVRDQKISRFEPSVDSLAWSYFYSRSLQKKAVFYHTGVEFEAWTKDGFFFTLHGTSTDPSEFKSVDECRLFYNLKTHRIKKIKPSPAPAR